MIYFNIFLKELDVSKHFGTAERHPFLLNPLDAAMQVGFPNEELFPQRGDAITYYVNGEKRMVRGEPGEAAVIHINGKVTGINTSIESNDKIEISPSTKGKAAELAIGKLPEFKSTLNFYFNGRKITSSRFVSEHMSSEAVPPYRRQS